MLNQFFGIKYNYNDREPSVYHFCELDMLYWFT